MKIGFTIFFNVLVFAAITFYFFNEYYVAPYRAPIFLATVVGYLSGSVLAFRYKLKNIHCILLLIALFTAVFLYWQLLWAGTWGLLIAYVASLILLIIFLIIFYLVTQFESLIINRLSFSIKVKQVSLEPIKPSTTGTPIYVNIKDLIPAKIFISYSHKDEEWKDQFMSHLSPLKNQGLIDEWNDRKIEAGMWSPQIEKAMESADLFLLLVTNNFLFSNYITSREITTAYTKYKEGKAKIFPVICDSCLWQLQPITNQEREWHPTEHREMYVWLGKFQPFPKDGKPIKNWINQQDAFLDVIDALKNNLQ